MVDDAAIGARTVVAADFNGDGAIDLASASKDDDTIAVYLNDPSADSDGRFPYKMIVSAAAKGAYSLVAVDGVAAFPAHEPSPCSTTTSMYPCLRTSLPACVSCSYSMPLRLTSSLSPRVPPACCDCLCPPVPNKLTAMTLSTS